MRKLTQFRMDIGCAACCQSRDQCIVLVISASKNCASSERQFLLRTAPVAEWFSLDHLIPLVSSLAWSTCETSKVLLVGGLVVFLGNLAFSTFVTQNDLLVAK